MGFQALSFLRVGFVQCGDGLLGAVEGPADGLGDCAGDTLVELFGRRGRLGIGEPSKGFGGGGVLACAGALGGVGLG